MLNGAAAGFSARPSQSVSDFFSQFNLTRQRRTPDRAGDGVVGLLPAGETDPAIRAFFRLVQAAPLAESAPDGFASSLVRPWDARPWAPAEESATGLGFV